MNIGVFYFSATGITELISKHIAMILEWEGHEVKLFNIITPKSRKPDIDFLKFDACFFGFPVFGGRPPTVVDDWMRTLNGKGIKCSMFFTYGARDLEWAHQVTYYLLTQAKFHVVLSAEFIGKHSFSVAEGWSLAENRPNQSDFDMASKFALESLTRFQEDTVFSIDLTCFSYHPKVIKESSGVWAHFYPSRGGRECCICYSCENECPVSAFDAETGEVNRNSCLACMHCVTICPDQIIHIGSEAGSVLKQFFDRWGLTREKVKSEKSKIIY